jgi:hypothetical protein
MGTDATAIVEVNLEGNWAPALLPIWHNPTYDPNSPDHEDHEEFNYHPHLIRDYSLFSLLADVRNRSGRGIKEDRVEVLPSGHTAEFVYDTDDGQHEPLAYIAEPRGIPEDASRPWRELCDVPGFHDHTWLSLEELIDAPWDQEVILEGVVLEEDYVKFVKTGKPPAYVAGGAGGPGVTVVSETEYAGGKRGEGTTVIRARWVGGTIRKRNGYIGRYLKAMEMLMVNDDPTSVRLLVAFDS